MPAWIISKTYLKRKNMKPTQTLKIKSIQTSLFPLGGDLAHFIIKNLSSSPVKEKTVLAISSKLFSLAQNRNIQTENKEQLIKKEADQYLGPGAYGFHLTIKEGLLLPSAGIDLSNSPTGEYLLFPKNPYLLLNKLWTTLKSTWNLKTLGLLMTDSHTTPLRRGVTGVALAHWGFQAVKDCRGQKDLYQKELKVTTINNVDALAAAAVWMMGEGSECRPLALIEYADLQWENVSSKKDIAIPLEEDLYKPLLEKNSNKK